MRFAASLKHVIADFACGYRHGRPGRIRTLQHRKRLPPAVQRRSGASQCADAGRNIPGKIERNCANRGERGFAKYLRSERLPDALGGLNLDEHAEGVNVTEFFASMAESNRSREKMLKDIRERLEDVPGIVTSTEQPLAHLISHMISGVKAQVGIKLYGDDLDTLAAKCTAIESVIKTIPGVTDAQVEQQTEIPQLQIRGQRRTTGTVWTETRRGHRICGNRDEWGRRFGNS